MFLKTTRLYLKIYEKINEKNVLQNYIHKITEAINTTSPKSMFFLTPK